jgi:hypothetical protein
MVANCYRNIDEFLNACEVLLKNMVEYYLKKNKEIKIDICLNLKFTAVDCLYFASKSFH